METEEIMVENTMSSNYYLIGVSDSSVGVEIMTGEETFYSDSAIGVEITPKVTDIIPVEIMIPANNKITAQYQLIGNGQSETEVEILISGDPPLTDGDDVILVEITPKVTNIIPVEIAVNASNKMSAQYRLTGNTYSKADIEILVSGELEKTNEYNEIEVEITPKVISSIPVEISVNASNKMSAQYQLVGSSFNTVETQITVYEEVVYTDESNVEVNIIAKVSDSIDVEIRVNPNGSKMSVRYELLDAPVIINELLPTKDTFVIENSPYSTINYGGNNSLITGVDYKGENISYLQFDLSSIDSDVRFKKAVLRLHFSQLSEHNIELYRIADAWSEYGTTFNNKPLTGAEVSNMYTINWENRYIEFDVSNITEQWIQGLPNNGLAILSSGNTSIFRTRESQQPPLLIVEHYPKDPPTLAETRKNVEITSRQNVSNGITVEIEAQSDFGFSYTPLDIFVHRYTDVYQSEIPIEINSLEYVKIDGQVDIPVEISCAEFSDSKIKTEITVPIYDGENEANVELQVRAASEVDVAVAITVPIYDSFNKTDVEIQIRKSFESTIPISIESYRNYKDVNSDKQIEIIVQKNGESKADVEIEIPFYEKETSIAVEMGVNGWENSGISVTIDAFRNYKNDESIVDTVITVALVRNSNTSAEITVPIYEGQNSIDTVIAVARSERFEVGVEIEVPEYDGDSDIAVQIYLPIIPPHPTRDGDSNVSVTLDAYRNYKDFNSEIPLEIRARLFFVSNVSTEITVGVSASKYSYVYIL